MKRDRVKPEPYTSTDLISMDVFRLCFASEEYRYLASDDVRVHAMYNVPVINEDLELEGKQKQLAGVNCLVSAAKPAFGPNQNWEVMQTNTRFLNFVPKEWKYALGDETQKRSSWPKIIIKFRGPIPEPGVPMFAECDHNVEGELAFVVISGMYKLLYIPFDMASPVMCSDLPDGAVLSRDDVLGGEVKLSFHLPNVAPTMYNYKEVSVVVTNSMGDPQ